MRNNPTKAERAMWRILKSGELSKFTFNRQKILGNYVVDFYCSKAKLVIEIDGVGHAENEQKEYDDERTAFLNGFNLHILRFWNNDVIENSEVVYDIILQAIRKSPLTPLSQEGDNTNQLT